MLILIQRIQSIFFPSFNFDDKIYSILFEGIASDCSIKYNINLTKDEVLAIIDLYLFSSKIICDEEFLNKYCSEDDIFEQPFDDEKK